MPSSPLDEFLQGVDPMDAATLFAGLRNSVPLSMLFRSGELNAGHDEELAKRQGPRTIDAPRPLSPDEVNRRAQMDFEAQYPDPQFRQMLINAMLRERGNPYSATTATRRRDFEEAPATARHSMQAAPRKYANGGAIDFSTPDMADGGAFIPDPQPFNKGGSAKKTLDEMAAEMMRKGVMVADKPDLSRRSFFGFGKGSDFPLAKMDTKALETLGKDAPAITEKSVTIDPGKGAAKSTLKSVSETPVSRREVLKSAAGQTLRGVLPDLGGLSSLGNVAKTVESMSTPAPALPQTLQGLIAHFAKKGFNEDETIKMLEKMGEANENDVMYMLPAMRNPYDFVDDLGEEAMKPSRALGNLINSDIHASPMTMRGPLREIKRENPDMYKDLIRAARDISEYGFE